MNINISSLKKSNMEKIKPFLIGSLEDLGVKYAIWEEILLKKKLRNYKLDSKSNTLEHNISILVHKIDGRLLLTGKSGIYEDYIQTKFRHYKGRILVLLLDEFDDDKSENQEILKTANKLVKDPKIHKLANGESYVRTSELKHNIFNEEEIFNLSDPLKGNQPIVKPLADNFKLIHVRGVINYYQL